MKTCVPVSLSFEPVGRARHARVVRLALLALATVTVAVTSAGPAHAANPRENEAAKLFYAGKYPEALSIYVDLAVATGDPAYMCEIGRCYSRMGKPEEASRNVRDCLSQATLPPKKKREFQALQAELDAARIANPNLPTPPATPGPPPAAQIPPPGAPVWGQPGGVAPRPQQAPPGYPPPPAGYQGAPPPGYTPAPGQPPAGYPQNPNAPGMQAAPGGPPPGWIPAPGQGLPPSAAGNAPGGPADNNLAASTEKPGGGGGSWMTPVAWIAGSVGVLAATGGVVAGLMAKSKFDDVAKEYNDAKYKNGKSLNTIQYLGYGVGALGIGTAITFFLLAPSSSESHAANDHLNLIASPDSIGLAGTF